jgi:GNAT superfamily N-acetyltransferase
LVRSPTIKGRLLVDNVAAPTFAVVQEVAEGTAYVGGAVTPSALAVAVEQLRSEQEVVICLWPDAPLAAMLPPAADYDGTAIDFVDRVPTVDLGALTLAPSGYTLAPITADLVPALSGYDYYIAMFGGAAAALNHTVGFCLLHANQVVSEAVAGPLTHGIAEIGAGTREEYRRNGLATVVAARVIQACEALGYAPFWNASQQNRPSVALAQRLGFQTERSFRVVAWSQRPSG